VYTALQVEFNELEESSVLATTIAWDDLLSWTWRSAVEELQSTLHKACVFFLFIYCHVKDKKKKIATIICTFMQISPSSAKVNRSTLQTAIMNLNHVPTKASWDLAVTKALQMIKGRQTELVKVNNSLISLFAKRKTTQSCFKSDISLNAIIFS
jgi:menaquinone-specific isochorismate synthase